MLPALAFVIAASSAVYVLRQNDYFWRNPLDRARIEQVTDFEGDELDADLSRDGKWMTFLSDRGGRFNAWVGQIASGNFVNVTKGRFPTLEPAPIHRVGFAADGAHVWFSAATASRCRIKRGLLLGAAAHRSRLCLVPWSMLLPRTALAWLITPTLPATRSTSPM
jgi:hypothetical protein